MFEKLFMLVKNNAGTAVIDNPEIPEKYREAMLNDASSSIIEVLKGQLEGGKLKDLIKYFQFPGVYNNPLIASAVKKFANKLNNFYEIDPAGAMAMAKSLIPPVMQDLIQASKTDAEFALSALLNKLNGGEGNMQALMPQLIVA